MMKDNTTSWEESQNQYRLLLEGMNELIKNTTRLAETYKSTNMDFANLIYENGLDELMHKANLIKVYEHNFELMYYSMKRHVEQLKQLMDAQKLTMIKDTVNYPLN
ncbi:hypothetical protein JMN32_21835 [Fulvivirga sp. 29W222]|uniref:Uncharacterized protein n=1 Tax=Fulvivirga marina TaxID=2494733 RepID=A0A937KDT0_9BACT|nr:hypothetical protein [Fulvivirga marina]MBL6448967.1 hypothetical protein [Fulvivirga marina]